MPELRALPSVVATMAVVGGLGLWHVAADPALQVRWTATLQPSPQLTLLVKSP